MATYAPITWDESAKRKFETGVNHCVLYKYDTSANKYAPGVAWNGITSVSETPEGADATDLWADNIKYASFRSAEKFGGSIEAYTYPDEFAECDGSAEPVVGVRVGQQARKKFGICYRTGQGTAADSDVEKNYLLHLVYGCTCSPSERQYSTINDSPDANTFSWEFNSDPVEAGSDLKPTSIITIDSTKVTPAKLKALEDKLYGTSSAEAYLPLPAEVFTTLQGA